MKLFTTSALVAAIYSLTALAKSGPITVAYVEVNNYNVSNVGSYSLQDGSNVFDIAIIFAANINYNGQKAVVFNNPQVQATLNNAATQIRPLQAKGIKVLLSYLGNHQGVGISNFQSLAAAQDFANQVASVVNQYGLDGVDLDDEYADYGTNGQPNANAQSISWVIQALRQALPNKLITFYYYGTASNYLAHASSSVGAMLNYSWNGVYSQYIVPKVPGLGRSQLSPAAVDYGSTSTTTAASLATWTEMNGYGVFMTYNLASTDESAYISSFTGPLYGQSAHHN